MDKKKKHECIGKDELADKTKTNIAEYGLQVIMVKGTSYLPSFAYSIGLFETYGQPEIICFGFSEKLGHAIINDVADLMKKGGVMKPGLNFDNIFDNSRAEFLPVDERNISDYFGAALNYYEQKKFPALQLVWTDRQDKFPWEPGFEEEFIYKQPLLDRNADFKFREDKRLTTFTTRQWLEEKKPVLHVVHDDDGYWQFLTGDQDTDDIRIVALKELVEQDPTLNEVFDLDYEEEAYRDFAGGKWTRSKIEREEE